MKKKIKQQVYWHISVNKKESFYITGTYDKGGDYKNNVKEFETIS